MSTNTAAITLTLASLAALALGYSQSLGTVTLVQTQPPQSKTVSAEPVVHLAAGGGLLDVPALARQTVTSYNLSVEPSMLVAMAYIESGFKPDAFRFEPALLDASVGLMQTLRATARQMWSAGYKAMGGSPDYTDLRSAAVSMYYGAAYVDWLKKWYLRNRGGTPSEEWLVRAYNGGPGWERGRASSLANTANHWRKYQDARRRFG